MKLKIVCTNLEQKTGQTPECEILGVIDISVDHMRMLGYEPEMHEEEIDNAFYLIG